MSKKIIIKSILIMFSLFGTAGCRTNYLHVYKESVYESENGVFVFKMLGSIEDKTENGKKIRVLANPYSLVIRFLSDREDWGRVKLENLRLVSAEGKEVLSEARIEKPAAGRDLEGRRFVGFTFGELRISYQTYSVFGNYEILDLLGNVLDAGEFEVILEKDYREESSNDLIDGAMGG